MQQINRFFATIIEYAKCNATPKGDLVGHSDLITQWFINLIILSLLQ